MKSLETEDIENATATKEVVCGSTDESKREGDILDVNGTKVVIIK